MRTPIAWAELHAPLFLSGTNLQLKLDPTKRVGLKLEFDEQKRHLYVTYNGNTSRVPETSVLSMVEAQKPQEMKIAVGSGVIVAPSGGLVEAQVSTPQSHVFAGLGAGQTGQEEPAKRKPGRPKGS